MSGQIKIIYNNNDPFANQPVPLIGLDYSNIYYGEQWGKIETLTLEGQITGCTFGNVVTGQKNLLNDFNKSFQTLQVWQQTGNISGLVFEKPFVEVQSIVFDQSRFVGAIPYVITLSSYPQSLFSGAYGVLDPSDVWDFQEQGDSTLNATHTISCRAFNTSVADNNSLENARNWAIGRTGLGSVINPIFISGVSTNNFCLLQLNETIDRFNGTYSLTETYTNDLARTGYGLIRYSTLLDSGDNSITVTLNGNTQGCNKNITGARHAFGRIDKVAIAKNAYQFAFARNDLNPTPLSQSFSEDASSARIDFSYTFDNDNSPDIVFDYTVDLSVQTNGFITASIQGTISVKNGDIASRLNRAKTHADSLSLYSLVLPFYVGFDASSSVSLNPIPISQSRSINQSDGTVVLAATFTNEEKASDILDIFDATLEFSNAVQQVNAQPRLNGNGTYTVVDLGFARRASLSINGTATIGKNFTSEQGVTAIKQKCVSLFNQYGRFSSVVLDQDNVNLSRGDKKIASFSFSWSFDGSPIGPSALSSLNI